MPLRKWCSRGFFFWLWTSIAKFTNTWPLAIQTSCSRWKILYDIFRPLQFLRPHKHVGKAFIGTYLDNRLSDNSVLWHDCSVKVRAKHGCIVIDICHIYVHCGDGTKWWHAAITSLHCQEVVPACLIVQRLGNCNGTWRTWGQRGTEQDILIKENILKRIMRARTENVYCQI